jgi:hypothetical protein
MINDKNDKLGVSGMTGAVCLFLGAVPENRAFWRRKRQHIVLISVKFAPESPFFGE